MREDYNFKIKEKEMQYWMYLVVAIIFEVIGTTAISIIGGLLSSHATK